MQQPEYVDISAYLVLEPSWHNHRRDDQGRLILEGGKVAKITQQRPSVTRGGVVTRVTFRVDAGAFLPLQPEAVVHIHPGNAETVTVEATDPREGAPDD